MNPLPKKPAAAGAGRTVVVGGGTPGAVVPFHQHPASAITTPVSDDQLPPRLGSQGEYEASNADNQVESGYWTALASTGNMPYSTHWVCQTLRSAVSDVTVLVQIAHEMTVPMKVYRRQLDVTTWSAWVEWPT